jgi:hypothetical protein
VVRQAISLRYFLYVDTRSAGYPFQPRKSILFPLDRDSGKGKRVTPAKAARPYGVVATGILSTAIALMSSRLDRLLFYFLASGSILLALTFSSLSLDSIFKRFRREGELRRESEPASSGD